MFVLEQNINHFSYCVSYLEKFECHCFTCKSKQSGEAAQLGRRIRIDTERSGVSGEMVLKINSEDRNQNGKVSSQGKIHTQAVGL